jgi:hypothetical protein
VGVRRELSCQKRINSFLDCPATGPELKLFLRSSLGFLRIHIWPRLSKMPIVSATAAIKAIVVKMIPPRIEFSFAR